MAETEDIAEEAGGSRRKSSTDCFSLSVTSITEKQAFWTWFRSLGSEATSKCDGR